MPLTDIQAHLADINARCAAAQAERDRQFMLLIALHIGVLVGAFFLFVSIPSCNEGFRQMQLANQEMTYNGR